MKLYLFLIRDNIYTRLAEKYKRDVRFIRRVTHHPFDFLSQTISDPDNHRPVRLRYLGIFYVKPYWRKDMKSIKEAVPEEGKALYARVPELKFNKVYINLKKGKVENEIFISDDLSVVCPTHEIRRWRYLDTVVE